MRYCGTGKPGRGAASDHPRSPPPTEISHASYPPILPPPPLGGHRHWALPFQDLHLLLSSSLLWPVGLLPALQQRSGESRGRVGQTRPAQQSFLSSLSDSPRLPPQDTQPALGASVSLKECQVEPLKASVLRAERDGSLRRHTLALLQASGPLQNLLPQRTEAFGAAIWRSLRPPSSMPKKILQRDGSLRSHHLALLQASIAS